MYITVSRWLADAKLLSIFRSLFSPSFPFGPRANILKVKDLHMMMDS